MATEPLPTTAVSPVLATQIGESSLSSLSATVADAQTEDPFARVVIVADHHDVASSARHLLGARDLINVTAQTGDRLAADLARPMVRPLGDDAGSPRRPLAHVCEFQVVRQVADD